MDICSLQCLALSGAAPSQVAGGIDQGAHRVPPNWRS